MTEPRDDDALDQLIAEALAHPAAVAPSPWLAARIVAAVRHDPPPPVPFPWRRVALGIVLAGAAGTLAALAPGDAAAGLPGVAASLPVVALAALPLLLGWAEAV